MRKFAKSTIALTLSLILIIGMFAIAATAAAAYSGTCGTMVTWALDETGTLTISGTGKMYNYDDYDETPWYSYINSIKSVVIGDGVTNIGEDAFELCKWLTSVTIGNDVITIGESAFEGCINLTDIKIPKGVTSIGEDAFEGCTGLKSIEISESVTRIGDCAFAECSGLESITVDNNNPVYDSRNDCNAIIETKTNTLVTGCKNTVIPGSVTNIGEDAFANCTALTSIEIPASVTVIGEDAFANCTALTSIEIPASVTVIGDDAFDRCIALTDVYYAGTEADKTKIKFGEDNERLKNAKWHYNVSTTEYLTAGLEEAALIAGNAQNNQMTYAYKTAVTFKVDIPENASAEWYIDGEKASTGTTLSVQAKTKSYKVTVIIEEADGTKTFDEENVTIKNSLFDIIIYFFKHLFNPDAYVVEQK